VEKKWKDFSLYKQGVILVILVFLLYNITANFGFVLDFFAQFLNVLAPFIIGFSIAYFLSRPVIKLDEFFNQSSISFIKNKSHILATLTMFAIVIAVVTIIVLHVSPIIVTNVSDLMENMPIYIDNVFDWIRSLGPEHWLYGFLPEIPAENAEIIDALLTDSDVVIDTGFLALVTAALETIVINLVSIGTSLLNFAMGMVIALYTLLYRVKFIELIKRIMRAVLKPKTLSFLKDYLERSNEIFYKFISAQFLDACILGTLAFILLAFIRVEYAMTLALLLGIFNMIPFFGSIVATIITASVTLFTGGLQQAVIVLIVLLILQQVDANFISPKITGDVLGLNPLLIISSIFILGSYLGIIGMFIAVPVAAMGKIFLEDYLVMREEKMENEANAIKNE